MKTKKAKIKDDASHIFGEQMNKRFRGASVPPKSYYDFHETLRKLQGKTFEVKKEYGNRVCLKYDQETAEKESQESKVNIVGIDLEKSLVEIEGEQAEESTDGRA